MSVISDKEFVAQTKGTESESVETLLIIRLRFYMCIVKYLYI